VSKNPEFYADFGSEEIIQKKCTEKRSDQNNFFGELRRIFFQEKLFFWDYLFSSLFFLNNSFETEISKNSYLFNTHKELFQEKIFFSLRREFCEFLTPKYEIRIAKAENSNKCI
jgi:hypothetical protein